MVEKINGHDVFTNPPPQQKEDSRNEKSFWPLVGVLYCEHNVFRMNVISPNPRILVDPTEWTGTNIDVGRL